MTEQSNSSAPPSSTPKRRGPKQRKGGRKKGQPDNKAERVYANAGSDEILFSELRKGRPIYVACRTAGYDPRAVFKRRDAHADFAADWDNAYAEGTATYEEEMRRRAIEGVKKPVYQNGKLVGHVQDYSDTLLIFALKARKPELYRENINVSGQIGHAHTHEVVLRDANERARAMLAKIAEPKVIEHV